MTKSAAGRNQFWLDLRVEEGRQQVSIELASLSKAERLFLVRLLQSATEGKSISFGVGEAENGAQVMQFTFADSLQQLAEQPVDAPIQ